MSLCSGALKPQLLNPRALELNLRDKRSHHNEKSPLATRETREKPAHSNKDPGQSKKKKKFVKTNKQNFFKNE